MLQKSWWINSQRPNGVGNLKHTFTKPKIWTRTFNLLTHLSGCGQSQMVQDEDRTLLANTLGGGVCEVEVVTRVYLYFDRAPTVVFSQAKSCLCGNCRAWASPFNTFLHKLCVLILYFKFLVLGYFIMPVGTANLKQMLRFTARKFSGFWYSVTFMFFSSQFQFHCQPSLFQLAFVPDFSLLRSVATTTL